MQQASADAGLARIRLFGFDSFEGSPRAPTSKGKGSGAPASSTPPLEEHGAT
jgi:hypothetical protein